jgi:hypothetical protein
MRNARVWVRGLPDPKVHEDLDAFLLRACGMRSRDLEAAAADPLGSEPRLEKVRAEVVDQRVVVKRDQHGRRNLRTQARRRRRTALHTDEGTVAAGSPSRARG